MRKRNDRTRIAAGLLAVILMLTTVFSGIGSTVIAEAAAAYDNQNLLVNPDFEETTAFSPAGGSHLGNWFYWQYAERTTEDAYSGNASVKFTGNDSALEQDVANLIVGQTYVYTIWAKVSKELSADSATHTIGVKNYGGTEIKQSITSDKWTKYELEFVYTGGNPRVYGYVSTHSGVNLYIDNASVTLKSDIESVSIENGKLTAKFVDSYTETPAVEDLSANYTVKPGNSETKKLVWTGLNWDAKTKTADLEFLPIAEAAVEQLVTVNLSYKGATVTLEFSVEANGEEVVTAEIASVTAENGKIQVILDADPTVAPTADDFSWEYKIDDGEYKTLAVTDYSYSSQTKTASVSFDEIRGTVSKKVTVKVSYGVGAKEADFITEASDTNIYYVDSKTGKDTNDGLSPETAFASIDKLNTITFLPGDQILFKKGETFVGCFKPQGSGNETAPIKISSYGEGFDKPVLQPGEDWTVEYIMSANAMVHNPKVNYVLQFYNVEYWEVSDLEIFDPNSEAYLTKGSDKYIGNSANDVYRSGITIQAEDCGVLEHFYIDNVVIHGFHGPGTNIGKTSGGITMNVITNKQRNVSLSMPTQINDIRVTNCEIYDVGRTGINFLTPWSFRTEEKWGPFDYGTRGYDYLPYEDFYMANNYIHDVDGDGTIIDNCSGAVAEYNYVTRCCLRPATEGGGAAVGLFNWNSDDTIFQFNEVCDIRVGSGASASNDGQGIEIDALNDRTWVQYNYVHDNMGGFMMLCNVGDNYRSFDGIVRYNISQDDYAHPRQGVFDIYSANYGTEIYNNTFYFTERVLKNNQIFLFSAVGAYETMKFYNNIFYYDGETPAAANTFGDNAIDWQSNIFYGFTNLPVNDNENAPNLNADPMLIEIGEGGTGEPDDVTGIKYNGEIGWIDLYCYETLENSPAINAGVPIENNGGRDYFGNKVAGIPDIGAYETGSVVLKLLSLNSDIVVDQEEKIISIADSAKITAKELLDSLVYEDGVTVEANRETTALEGGIRLAEGDTVTGNYKDQKIIYTVKIVEGEDSEYNVIPPEHTNAAAGSEETAYASDAASNAIDENVGTMWHTSWYDTVAAENKYLTLEIKDGYEYEISGYVYTPRQSGTNGIITGYEIYTSNDNKNWDKAAEGTWPQDNTVKSVMFDEAVSAKYVKLLATASAGGFVSAAEARLIGEKIDTDVPTAPVLKTDKVTGSGVSLSWKPSEDANGIAEYVLLKDGKEIAVFDPDVTSYEVTGLASETKYTFTVYAVDTAGKKSEDSVISVTTTDKEAVVNVTRVSGKTRYETGYKVADELKTVLGVDKFEAVVIATGKNFADALAGSYLAVEKNAPIILTNGKADNIAALHDYIKANVAADGKVYILGGEAAVPAEAEAIDGYEVVRLSGKSRYETNLAILNEAGVTGDSIIVATGKAFADSLSASAAKLPILLVKPGTTLNEEQKAIVRDMKDIYIIGGDGAVGADIASELASFGEVTRLSGKTRYETSVAVANAFFEDVDTVVAASGKTFPDGLCGGPLAAAMNAPLILTADGKTSAAEDYMTDCGAAGGFVLGGTGALSDESVVNIFALENADQIVLK